MTRRILVIKSSSMGDVIHALPVAWDIKRALPDCELHWVVEESFSDIVSLSPFVDKKVVTAFRRWRKHPFASQTREEFSDLRRALRTARYEAVIDIQGLLRTALVARLSAAESWGYSKNTIREPLASRFYTHTLEVPESLRPVRRYRTMASRVLGYEIDPDSPHYGLKVKPLAPAGVTGPYAALAVNTSRAEKLWPQQRWIEVASELARDGLQSVLFWGSESERRRVEEIAAAVDGAVVMPRSSLAALAQAIAGANCLAGVDTGLTHLGAALGVPSVGIIVGTSAALFSLVSERACATVGDKGVVPGTVEVLSALQAVMHAQQQ